MFHIAGDDVIRRGECTDIYFQRCEEILRGEGINPEVTMEVTATSLPEPWAVFCGLEDVLSLLQGLPIDVDAMQEGTIFLPNEPVLRIRGKYLDFARYETAILGFLCHASGIATASAHIRICAQGRPVYSFGSRRQHPSIAPMVERASWIGGVDGGSNISAPEGIPVIGTMPHAFVMCFPTPDDAWKSFDLNAPPEVPRIMLSDTFCDEKNESLRAAKAGASAIRLDTPRSRRGNMRAILEEVRWELDSHGYPDVKIFLSGGVTREDVEEYRDLVDAFGIGGAIANAPVVDFSLDIVEINGKNLAKRGKRSGVKQVWVFPDTSRRVLPANKESPDSGTPQILDFLRKGQLTRTSGMREARSRLILQLATVSDF